MYDHILLPVDLSDANLPTFERAVRLGDPEHTQITLLHVIATVDDISPEDDPDFYDELRDNAQAKLGGWSQRFADEGYDVTAEITYGATGQEIARVAADTDVDLVVLRSHVVDPDADNAARTKVGTVSHQVALFAPCSVLLVRA